MGNLDLRSNTNYFGFELRHKDSTGSYIFDPPVYSTESVIEQSHQVSTKNGTLRKTLSWYKYVYEFSMHTSKVIFDHLWKVQKESEELGNSIILNYASKFAQCENVEVVMEITDPQMTNPIEYKADGYFLEYKITFTEVYKRIGEKLIA